MATGIRKSQSGYYRISDEGSEHVKVTLGEVEYLNNPKDQRKTSCHQCIDATAHQSVYENLCEQSSIHVASPLPKHSEKAGFRADKNAAIRKPTLLLEDILEVDHARFIREFGATIFVPIFLVGIYEAIDLDGHQILILN